MNEGAIDQAVEMFLASVRDCPHLREKQILDKLAAPNTEIAPQLHAGFH
jgi:hypothetical protein